MWTLFNKQNDGAMELRRLTGNYYANNDFSKVEGELLTAADELAQVTGAEVMNLAATLYARDEQKLTTDERTLLRAVRLPVALLGTLRMYQKNDLSHEDDGRKFKVAADDTEKLPWQWQLDRDDAVQMEAYYAAVNRLIALMNRLELPEWLNSTPCRALTGLLIRSAADMERYFPIDGSERTFLLMAPFVREVQTDIVQPAYGKQWGELLAENDPIETEVHYAACKAVALLAMATVLRRGQLMLIPGGVVRRYLADNGMTRTAPANTGEVQLLARGMERTARHWIDRMKTLRDSPDYKAYRILPNNDRHNKYMSL